MVSIEDRIKQETKSATYIHDYTVIFFDKIRNAVDEHKARKAWSGVCDKKEWVRLDVVLKILEDEKQFSSEQGLLEDLASLEHEQWSHWISVMKKRKFKDLGQWFRQAQTPYAKLSEKEKESDCEWARKVLSILKVQLLFEKLKWTEVEKQKLKELADLLEKRPSWEWMKDNLDKLEDIEFAFREIEKKFAELGLDTKRLECFGTATPQDCCLQCPDNEECVNETMRKDTKKET